MSRNAHDTYTALHKLLSQQKYSPKGNENIDQMVTENRYNDVGGEKMKKKNVDI